MYRTPDKFLVGLFEKLEKVNLDNLRYGNYSVNEEKEVMTLDAKSREDAEKALKSAGVDFDGYEEIDGAGVVFYKDMEVVGQYSSSDKNINIYIGLQDTLPSAEFKECKKFLFSAKINERDLTNIRLWVVKNPTELSEIGDVFFEVNSIDQLFRIFAGTIRMANGDINWKTYSTEDWKIYDDEMEAKADADQRMASMVPEKEKKIMDRVETTLREKYDLIPKKVKENRASSSDQPRSLKIGDTVEMSEGNDTAVVTEIVTTDPVTDRALIVNISIGDKVIEGVHFSELRILTGSVNEGYDSESGEYKSDKGQEPLKFEYEDYDWGRLRKIEVGSSFSIIIHPESWDEIVNMINAAGPNAVNMMKFTDETGKTWKVDYNYDNGELTFSCPDVSDTVTVTDGYLFDVFDEDGDPERNPQSDEAPPDSFISEPDVEEGSINEEEVEIIVRGISDEDVAIKFAQEPGNEGSSVVKDSEDETKFMVVRMEESAVNEDKYSKGNEPETEVKLVKDLKPGDEIYYMYDVHIIKDVESSENNPNNFDVYFDDGSNLEFSGSDEVEVVVNTNEEVDPGFQAENPETELTDMEDSDFGKGSETTLEEEDIEGPSIDDVKEGLYDIETALNEAIGFVRSVMSTADAMGGEIERVVGGQLDYYLLRTLESFIEDERQSGSVASLRNFLDNEYSESEDDDLEESKKKDDDNDEGSDKAQKEVSSIIRKIHKAETEDDIEGALDRLAKSFAKHDIPTDKVSYVKDEAERKRKKLGKAPEKKEERKPAVESVNEECQVNPGEVYKNDSGEMVHIDRVEGNAIYAVVGDREEVIDYINFDHMLHAGKLTKEQESDDSRDPIGDVLDSNESELIKDCANRLLVVKHLKEKKTLTEKEKKFISETENMKLSESVREKVWVMFNMHLE